MCSSLNARFTDSSLAEVDGFSRAMKICNQKGSKAGVPHVIFTVCKRTCTHDKRKLKAKSDISGCP
jgi:hypothetical protein